MNDNCTDGTTCISDDRQRIVPTMPEVEVAAMLSRIPSLRFASTTGLRALTTKATVESVEAGEDVIVQGARSDDVYYIVNGLFEVLISQGGNTPDFIRVLRAGDSFGELGVLYAVPRTATIRCTAAGEVLRLPGDAFLDALDTEG
jgi:CRP-like cAMP-binding protein